MSTHLRALGLLRLLQLFDSQFPVGAFAHSGGVETYAALGGGRAELAEILATQIEFGWGRSELAAAFLARRTTPGVRLGSDWGQTGVRLGSDHLLAQPREKRDCPLFRLALEVDARKVVPAVRNASIGLGRRTLELLRRLHPETTVDVEPPHHAVVIGAAGRWLGIEPDELLLAYAHSLAAGTVAAALRCMAVSPAQGQALIAAAHPAMARAVDRAIAEPELMLFACTPALDIRCHQQAFLNTRLFQS